MLNKLKFRKAEKKTKALLTVILLFVGMQISQAQYNDSTKTYVAQKFLGNLSSGDFGGAVRAFSWDLAGTLNQYWLKVIWESVQKQNGKYMGCYNTYTDRVTDEVLIYQECRFEQIDKQLKLVFDKENKIKSIHFVPARPTVMYEIPTYVDLSFMVETDVTIRSGKYNLQATFTYPMNGTHFPTIVMVAGEGPCDMDVSKGPNKFFKDLACGFAMNGIASLRFNKRTYQYPEVNDAPLTGFTPNEEIIEDAIAAVRSAKSILAVDTTRVFLLGHGLGAHLLPLIAQTTKPKGMMLIGAPGLPYEDVVYNTQTYINNIAGTSTLEMQDLVSLKERVDSVKLLNDSSDFAPYELPLEMPVSYWMFLKNYNAVKTATALNLPMFFIYSGRDFQTTAADMEVWKKAMANKNNVQFKFYENLNYYLHFGDKPSTPDEYIQKKQASKVAIDEMSKFVMGK